MGKESRQIVALTVLNALAQVVGFGYRVVMARMVGAEVMGLYQLVMSAYGVIQSITTVGLTSALSTLTSQCLAVGDRAGVERLRKCCLGLFCALMIPVGGGVILFSDQISVSFLGDARTRLGLILLIPCLTLTAMENLHKNAFYGAGRPIPPAAAEVWEQLVRAGAVLGLLYLFLPQYPERAVGLVMWGMILCEVSSAITLYTLYRQCFGFRGGRGGGSAPHGLRQIAAIAIPLGANALLGNLLGAANSALIPQQLVRGGMERSQAISALGVVCGMTAPMVALPTVYLSAVNLILMPKLARSSTLGRQEEVGRLISHGVATICRLTVPCMVGMGVFGGDLGRLLYGRGDVGEFLVPLAAAMGLNCCVSVLACSLNSIGGQRTVACVTLVGGMVQLCCTWGLTTALGMGGYVVGAAACSVTELVLCLAACRRRAPVKIQPVRWLLAPGLAALLAGLNGRLLLRFLTDCGADTPVRLAVAGGMALGQYLIAFWLLDRKTPKI